MGLKDGKKTERKKGKRSEVQVTLDKERSKKILVVIPYIKGFSEQTGFLGDTVEDITYLQYVPTSLRRR